MNNFFLIDFKSYKTISIIQICLDPSVTCKLKLLFPMLLSTFCLIFRYCNCSFHTTATDEFFSGISEAVPARDKAPFKAIRLTCP